MSKLQFDANGNPALFMGKGKIIAFQNPEESPNTVANTKIDYLSVGSYKYIPWTNTDDYPEIAAALIAKTPVLQTVLNTKTRINLGQGIFPCRVLEYKSTGEEIVEVINDPVIIKSMQSEMIRRYLVMTSTNLQYLGNAFVQFIPSKDGSKILRLNPVSSKHCRLGAPNEKTGGIDNVLVSGGFATQEQSTSNTVSYPLLDETDPFGHLLDMRIKGTLKKGSVYLQLKNDFSLNDFYAMPDWQASKAWIDITNKVPVMINAGIDNAFNMLYLIRIPVSFWENKYPRNKFEGKEKERKDLIEADINNLDEKFTKAENAKKTLITTFGYNEGTPDADKWDVETKEIKYSQENFVTSTAADTQIAIAQGINPDLLGLMMGNSKGGSMQRELLLIQYALAWSDRQKLANPIEMMLRFNLGDAFSDLELRFRNTFLTTLDSGNGTQTTLS